MITFGYYVTWLELPWKKTKICNWFPVDGNMISFQNNKILVTSKFNYERNPLNVLILGNLLLLFYAYQKLLVKTLPFERSGMSPDSLVALEMAMPIFQMLSLKL